jgi:hypothetical protein
MSMPVGGVPGHASSVSAAAVRSSAQREAFDMIGVPIPLTLK